MNKKRASEMLLFKMENQENLQLFLTLIDRASKGIEMFVETKLSNISIKLFGDREKVRSTSSKIRHYYGLLKSASRVNHANQRRIPSELIALLTKQTPDKLLLADVLNARGFPSTVFDDSIITSSSLTTVLETTKIIVQRLKVTLPGEPKHIRKFLVLLSFKFPQSTVENLLNFGITHKKFGRNESGYYFMSPNDEIYEYFCNNYVPTSHNQLVPSTQPEAINPLPFKGGSISFKKK